MRILDCKRYKLMLISAANNLDNKHLEIDKLNVFPVPDGDTGTNMNMTFSYGIDKLNDNAVDSISETAKFFAKNMLMGARGNSGVILSQIFKGMAKAIDGQNTITVDDLSRALLNGARVAYKAVMRPTEGTILTVIREAAEYGEYYLKNHPRASFEDYFEFFLQQAKESLIRTPELLPVLKDAGVVDSGAAGLVAVFEGMYLSMIGQDVKSNTNKVKEKNNELKGYSFNIVIELKDKYKKAFDINSFNDALANRCSQIVVKRENNLVTVQGITLALGDLMNYVLKFGVIDKSVITKDDEQVQETAVKEHTKYALITVCNGQGIVNKFKELGVEYIINGGQTMNPSTQEFVSIINDLNSDHIIILPNNKNIILAANQAKEIVSDKDIHIIETTTIMEGICACNFFNVEGEIEENINNMNEGKNSVKTLAVTTAIKDTIYESLQIHKNDYIGIVGKAILSSNSDMILSTKNLIKKAVNDDDAFVTIIYGSNADNQQAQEILKFMEEMYDIEGQIINGQQDLYPFIIGVE